MVDTLRVLYVDDELDLLDIGKLFLEGSGDFSVTTINSALAALSLISKENFDTIISDYQMPGMDGIQFLIEVRKRFGSIPFILFTGKGREEVVIQAINSGADFYLQKGGDPSAQFAELVHKIKQAALRNKAEKSLRKSEEKYRHLIEHSNEAIVVAQDGMLKLVNHRLIELLGYSEQELLSTQFPVFIHPDDRAMVVGRYQKRLKGEEYPSRYSFRLNQKDGNILWVEISAVVIDWDGRPATLNFLTDITERKKAEEELKKSEALLKRTGGIARVGGWELDAETHEVTWSEETYHIHEVPVGQMPPLEEAINFFHPDDRKKLSDAITRSLTTGEGYDLELRIITATGKQLWTRTLCQPQVVDGKTIRLEGTFQDITDRKQAEEELLKKNEELSASYEEIAATQEELRESEEKYRTVADFTYDWEYLRSPDGNYIYVSPSCERITGYRSEEFMLDPSLLISIVHPDDVDRILDHLSNLETDICDKNQLEFRIISRSGEERWIGHRCQSVYGRGGMYLGSRGSNREISERKRVEGAMQESEDRFRGIFDTITSGVAIYEVKNDGASGKDYIIKNFNRTALLMEGKKKEDVIGKSLFDLRPAIDEYGLIPVFQQVWKSGVPGYFPQKVYIDEKYSSWYENRVFRLQGGEIIAVYDDITERKVAEEALKISELDLREAQAIARLGRWDLDLIHNTLHWSEGIYQLFEISPAEFGATYESFLDCIHPDDRDRVNAAYNDSLKTKKPYEISHRLCMNDGRVKWVREICHTEYDLKGQPIRSVGVVQEITEIKRAEEEIMASEEKYRSLFTSMINGFALLEMIYDEQGIPIDCRYVEVNPAHETLTGLKKEAIIGHTARECIPGLEDYWIERYGRVDKSGTSEYFENYVAGLNRWYGVFVYRTTPGFVAVTFENITGRKLAEDALQIKDFAIRSSTNAIALADLSGNLTDVNPAFLSIWGYEDRLEVLGRSVSSFWKVPNEAQKVIDAIQVQGTWSGEMSGQRKDGTQVEIQLSANLVRDASGTPVALMGSFIDITERKQAEEALRESKALIDAVVENVPLMIFLKEATDLRFVVFNRAGEELLGYDRKALLGRNNLDLFPPEQAAHFMTKDREVLDGESGMLDIPEESILTAKKGQRLLHTRKVCIRGSDGTTKFLLGISEDITERKELENEMVHQEHELRQFSTALAAANRKLTLLSSITRHDINNQLTVLRGYLTVLEKKQPDPSLNEYFRKVSTAAKRISAMIRFTKEYEEIGVHAPAWQDTRTLVDTTAKQALLGKVMVKNDLPAGTEVFVDPLVVKVFYNLMDNAVRYGGKITSIRFSALECDEDRIIVCEDDGDGIPAEEKEKIFERGFGKNTGMGLALSREILDITGITITETGEAGKGARFEMIVPKGMWRMAGKKEKMFF